MSLAGLIASLVVVLQLTGGTVWAAPGSVPGRVLVRLRPSVNARTWTQRGRAGREERRFDSVPGLRMIALAPGESADDAIDDLRRDPDVLYAEPDYLLEAFATPNDARFGDLWGLHNVGQDGGNADADIDAPEAWNRTTGSPDVVVAVIDTGIDYTHPDLAANMFRNVADCDANGVDDDANGWIDDCYGIDTANDDADPFDDNRHGTHVAGTIGATGNNGVGVVGVNWTTRLLACKFLSASGSGATSDAVACLDYVKQMKDRGVNVVATNNSWGGGGYSRALVDAIDAQRESGILFIAAAGNSSYDVDRGGIYPAGLFLPNLVAVAATTDRDALADFSNFGHRSVHLGAPGDGIVSTVPGGGYASLRGTSMATPHVTGVAALLAADDPSRDWRAIRNLLLTSGDAVAAMGGRTLSGTRLNAMGALGCTGATLAARVQPRADRVIASTSGGVLLAAVHVTCAAPAGALDVTVAPTGETITLADDGLNGDAAAGDGTYTARWLPPAAGTFMLTFPGSDVVTVDATIDAIGDPIPAPGEWFGHALATLGDDVLVGVPFDTTDRVATGSVQRIDPVTRTVEQTYLSPVPHSLDRFGWSVTTDGAYLLIGAPRNDDTATNAGAAYLFDATSGAYVRTLHSPAGVTNEYFGWAVLLVDDLAVVGAPSMEPFEVRDAATAGSAYVFDLATGALVRTLTVPLEAPTRSTGFGFSLARTDDRIAVGAVGSLKLFLYDRHAGSPTFLELMRTIQSPPKSALTFGVTLLGMGDRLAAGDPLSADPATPGAVNGAPGAVYLYDQLTGALDLAIRNPSPTVLAAFGASLATYGADLVVGAPEGVVPAGEFRGTGRVYVMDPSIGGMKRVLTSPAIGFADAFGTSVTTVGNLVVGGAPLNDIAGEDAGTIVALDPAVAPPPSVAFASRCYTASFHGTPQRFDHDIVLRNAFETRTARLQPSLRSFCVPGSVEGSVVDMTHSYLACHKTKNAIAQRALPSRTIEVQNLFGSTTLRVGGALELCGAASVVGELYTPIDTMSCYPASLAPKQPRPSATPVGTADRFTTARTRLIKPYRYCVPTDLLPDVHPGSSLELTCYKARDVATSPPLTDLSVLMGSTFTAGPIRLKRLGTFCIASTRTPAPF